MPALVPVALSQVGCVTSLQSPSELQVVVHKQCRVGPGPGQHSHDVPAAQEEAHSPAAPPTPPTPAPPTPAPPTPAPPTPAPPTPAPPTPPEPPAAHVL